MNDPDLILLEGIARGDQGAFESLIGRYQGPLHNFIGRYVGDASLAEDIAQEVFIRVFRAARRFEPRTRVSTWIFRIAYNLSMTELDRLRRRQKIREAVEEHGEGGEPACEPAERLELEEELTAALEQLPGNQRAALLLRVNEGLSYREIGQVLGVSLQSVESLLHRARSNLKRYLEKS
ncbi:MAG: RNA polymerase sigma factor [Desulfobacteraceae bacterium]|nr:RNA polymerase sigma factor [Desulfobacteraceae bacterium]